MTDRLQIFLGLDYGSVRIGVARADSKTKLASPLMTLTQPPRDFRAIEALITDQAATALIVGLPRSLDGEDTAQTATARKFARELARFGLPIHLVDEAGTSSVAEERLQATGKPYARADIDAEAAAIILQDYLDNL